MIDVYRTIFMYSFKYIHLNLYTLLMHLLKRFTHVQLHVHSELNENIKVLYLTRAIFTITFLLALLSCMYDKLFPLYVQYPALTIHNIG